MRTTTSPSTSHDSTPCGINATEPVLIAHDIGPGARAFTTTRQGGHSQGVYGKMNINPHCGDSPQAVEANRHLLANLLGIDAERIIVPHQVHGTELRFISNEYFELSAATKAMLTEGVDGLITRQRGVCIGVSTADCLPIVLHDAATHTIAAVHAGWRGTVKRIAQLAVEAMARMGCHPADIRAAIGPGISMEAFEVGNEVYEAFAEAHFPMPQVSRQYATDGNQPPKWHINLAECNRQTLLDAGLQADSIATCQLCTYSHTDRLFSARRLGTASGRLYTGIMLI